MIARPSQVVLAMKLAFVGAVVGLIATSMSWDYYSALVGPTWFVVHQALALIVTIWIYYKMYVGRNWARILYLLLSLAGILSYSNWTVRALFASAPPIARISTIVNIGVNIAILWLVFTVPGSKWFKRTRNEPAA